MADQAGDALQRHPLVGEQPLSRWAPAPGVRWLPLTGAEPYELAVVWTPRAPESLVARLVAEIRKIIA